MAIGRNARGEAVVDVQNRLVSLGHPVPAGEAGRFGEGTEQAVRAFQERRGLQVDGIVGPETWQHLVEASWRLGDRTLYLRSPNLRGDDVRALQDRLSALGFHRERVDGIFGPQTADALSEFQGNYGLPADGIVGEATLRALAGLTGGGGETPVAQVREREALRHLPRSLAGMRIVVDPGHGTGDPGFVGKGGARESQVTLTLARLVEAALAAAGATVYLTRDEAGTPLDSDRAALANRLAADLYLSLHAGGDEDRAVAGAVAYHFGHERYGSDAGRRLAEALLAEAAALGIPGRGAHPRTVAILRETRMPAVQFEPGYLTNPEDERRLTDPKALNALAASIATALARFAREAVNA